MVMRFQIWQDSRREWRWRLKAANGRVIAVSSEGYKEKRRCKEAIELVQEATFAEIEEV